MFELMDECLLTARPIRRVTEEWMDVYSER